MAKRKAWAGKLWLIAVLAAVGACAAGAYYLTTKKSSTAQAAESRETDASDEVRVEVTHALKGVMPRTTTQPGSVQSFESADLYAGASGYLGMQKVDIGDKVTKGETIAQVDVPDLVKAVEQRMAELDAAKARVVSAQADVDAARAEVTRAEKAIKSTHATAVFRGKQFKRMQDLYATKSIDERLVDEKEDERDAAEAAEDEAKATRVKADALVAAANAKVGTAQADATVAQAALDKAQVMVDFATIKSPYTGVITRRAFFPGDYIRAAAESGGQPPLLRVERTDKMRLVVEVPDRDVPFCNVGDPAQVELDALPGAPLQAKVSRMADSEDPSTRLMHVEIDLDNPTGKIAQGMYGHVTIVLDQGADLLSLPSSCLAGKPETGKASIFVVRDGKAYQVTVTIGTDNGVRVAVLKGLTIKDAVVLHPPSDLIDGTPVVASEEKDETQESGVRGQESGVRSP